MTYQMTCPDCETVGEARNWDWAQTLIAGHQQLYPGHTVEWDDRDGGDA